MLAAHFPNRASLISFLGEKLVERRLAIFLGSGVSKELIADDKGVWSGLPTWPGLINNLYEKHGETPPGSVDLPTAAEMLRECHYHGNDDAWLRAVTDALYKGIDLDFKAIRKNDLLGAIGALAISSVRGAVADVVTFNFDDVLDRYLAYHGLVVRPISEEHFWAESGDVILYHPHGFLPSPGSPFGSRSSYIVLDRRSFAERAGQPDLRMNQKMETIMQSHICLFIGLSGDDLRLDSLIVTTHDRKKHAYNPTAIGYWGVAFSTKKDSASKNMWENRGIYLHTLDKYSDDLPQFLFEICQSAASK